MKRSSYQLSDGRTLSWLDEGQGPPLVLLHGWSMSAAVFTEMVARLSGRYRLLCPDLPGHGHSSPAESCTLTSIAADVEEWLSGIDAGAPCLVGWSLGGMVAIEMVVRHPNSYAKLVLMSSTAKFSSAEDWPYGLPPIQVKSLKRNLTRRFETTLADFYELMFDGVELDSRRVSELEQMTSRMQLLPDPASAAEMLDLLERQDQRILLGNLELPVLVLHGTQDRIVPVAAGRQLADNLPDVEFVMLPEAGHAPFLCHPEPCAMSLEAFC